MTTILLIALAVETGLLIAAIVVLTRSPNKQTTVSQSQQIEVLRRVNRRLSTKVLQLAETIKEQNTVIEELEIELEHQDD